jgi:hypothetical protein
MFGASQSEETEIDARGDLADVQLFRWRFDCLIDAGADRILADWIACDRSIDLHQACALLAKKGPVWTADYYRD